MCPAQGHNAVAPVWFEPATPPSQVKHSSTEPLYQDEHISLNGLEK